MAKRTVIMAFDDDDRACFRLNFGRHYQNDIKNYSPALLGACRAVNNSYRPFMVANSLACKAYVKASYSSLTGVEGRLKFVFTTVRDAAKAKLLLCGRELITKF